MRLIRLCVGAWFVIAVGCGGCDDTVPPSSPDPDSGADVTYEDVGPDAEPDVGLVFPDVAYAPQPTSVETQVLNADLVAGETLITTCTLLDEQGFTIEQPDDAFSLLVAPEESFTRTASDWIAVRAGTGFVRCAHVGFGLVDDTPVEVTIVPGEVDRTAISLDKTQIEAGGTVTASCTLYDAYGNEVDSVEPTLVISPDDPGNVTSNLSTSHGTAGIYDASCSVPGATSEQIETFEVVPSFPANLVISKSPNQSVYAQGQVVQIDSLVSDRYGNVIDNPQLEFVSVLPGSPFGQNRFRYFADGVYTVTVTVTEETQDGLPLVASVDIVVNGQGPSIQCTSPSNGEMLQRTNGSNITFTGAVADGNGVQSVTVNGTSVTIGANGTFSHTMQAQYGVNFVEISAIDQFNTENSKVCAFLSAPSYDAEAGFLESALTFRINQAAVDDNNSNDLDSLDDILHRVVNSSGLVDQIDAALNAANPLKPYSCDQTVFGICVLRSGVTYLDLNVGGPNTTTLDLVTNGLRATATIRNIGIRNRVNYQIAGINGTTTGTATVSSVSVDLTLDIALQNGQLSASVRQVNNVSVGNVTTSYNGLDGAIINIVVALFNGTVKNLVRNTIRDFINSSFDQVLDDLFGSLDIASFGTSFNVPNLDGNGSKSVGFAVDVDHLSTTSSRMRLGIGTNFTATPGQGRPSLGIPLTKAPPNHYSGATADAVLVAVNLALFNDLLHTLWRSGYFDVTVDGSVLGGGLPAGASATLVPALPPVVKNLSNGTTQLMLGAFSMTLVYPGLFPEGLALDLGAVASTGIALNGDDLTFNNVTIDQLLFSTDAVSLDSASRALIENFLRELVQRIVDTTLNQSLPSLPIPVFTIPSSMGQYGLPVGADLGIRNPTLNDVTTYYILSGPFGVR